MCLDREETAPLTHDKGHNCASCLDKDVRSAEPELAAVLSVRRLHQLRAGNVSLDVQPE